MDLLSLKELAQLWRPTDVFVVCYNKECRESILEAIPYIQLAERICGTACFPHILVEVRQVSESAPISEGVDPVEKLQRLYPDTEWMSVGWRRDEFRAVINRAAKIVLSRNYQETPKTKQNCAVM
jgi:hypothetical protein